jgi:hypothetical protein
MRLPLTLACRRRERDHDRRVAVELHGQLRRHDVHAWTRCGRFALTRDRGRATLWCAADPCVSASDGDCDVPRYCAAGDYIDCGASGPVVNGTLPDAMGSLTCRSKITRVCARPPARRSCPCNVHPTPQAPRMHDYYTFQAECSQGHHGLPRPHRHCAVDDLRADRAHVLVRPHAQPGSRRCGAYVAARAWPCMSGAMCGRMLHCA